MTDVLRVHLREDGVAWAFIRQGRLSFLKPTQQQLIRSGFAPASEQSVTAVLVALKEVLKEAQSDTPVDVLLPVVWLKLSVLPFDVAFRDEALHLRAAVALIAQQFRLGSSTPALRVVVEKARWQKDSLIAGLDASIAEAIEHAVVSYGCRLQSLHLAVLPAFSLCEVNTSLCVIDGSRQVVIRNDEGGNRSLRVLPFDPANIEASLSLASASASGLSLCAPGVPLPSGSPHKTISLPTLPYPANSHKHLLGWVLAEQGAPSLNLVRTAHSRIAAVLTASLLVGAAAQLYVASNLDTKWQSVLTPEDTIDAAPISFRNEMQGNSHAGNNQALEDTRKALLLPWEPVLDALTEQATQHITLRTIEPNAAERMVLVSGIATDRSKFLEYVDNLSNDVRLVSAEPIADTKMYTPDISSWEFRLRVTWRGTP